MRWASANSFIVKNGSHLLRTYRVPNMVLRGFISITPEKPHDGSLKGGGERSSFTAGYGGPWMSANSLDE